MKTLLTILIFSSFLISTININATPNESSKISQKENLAKVMANKLQEKILLSDSQTAQVEAILNSYLSLKVKSDKDADNTLTKIESLLDKRQKAKFSIVKDDWWAYLNKHLNN